MVVADRICPKCREVVPAKDNRRPPSMRHDAWCFSLEQAKSFEIHAKETGLWESLPFESVLHLETDPRHEVKDA